MFNILPETHCFELFSELLRNNRIQVTNVHFEPDNLTGEIIDKLDNQRYQLTVTPLNDHD